MNAVLRMLAAKRRHPLRHIAVLPRGAHKDHSAFTRMGAFFTRERADFLIGTVGIIGLFWVVYEIAVGAIRLAVM